MIEVILLERIENLGQMGDTVRVRPGFARNYLLPKQKALRATKQNLAYFETQRAQLEAANLARRSEAEKVSEKVDGRKIVMIRQAGETGQLYGSVTARDVADGLTADGVSIERQQVILDKPIKTLGLHDIRLRLHPEVAVTVTINVARSNEEAEMQAETGQMITAESRRQAFEEEEDALIDEALAGAEALGVAGEEGAEAESAEPTADEKGAAEDENKS